MREGLVAYLRAVCQRAFNPLDGVVFSKAIWLKPESPVFP